MKNLWRFHQTIMDRAKELFAWKMPTRSCPGLTSHLYSMGCRLASSRLCDLIKVVLIERRQRLEPLQVVDDDAASCY